MVVIDVLGLDDRLGEGLTCAFLVVAGTCWVMVTAPWWWASIPVSHCRSNAAPSADFNELICAWLIISAPWSI